MFELEPGPLERLTLDLLEPFPSRPSFEGLLSGAREQLVAHEPTLTGAAIAVGENPTAPIDARYQATIGGAAAHVDAEIGTEPSTPTSALVESGDNIDQIRRSVLGFLPPPDAPIAVGLEPPPQYPTAENPFPNPPSGEFPGETPT